MDKDCFGWDDATRRTGPNSSHSENILKENAPAECKEYPYGKWDFVKYSKECLNEKVPAENISKEMSADECEKYPYGKFDFRQYSQECKKYAREGDKDLREIQAIRKQYNTDVDLGTPGGCESISYTKWDAVKGVCRTGVLK